MVGKIKTKFAKAVKTVRKKTEEKPQMKEELEELPDLEVVEDNTSLHSPSVAKFKQNIPMMSVPSKTKLSLALFSFVFGAFIGSMIALLYNQNMNQNKAVKEKTEISQISALPADKKVIDLARIKSETKPTIALIKDAETIKNMPAFYFAQSGDMILIYDDMTLIYDPNANKVVSMIPKTILERLPGGMSVTDNEQITDENGEFSAEDETTPENMTDNELAETDEEIAENDLQEEGDQILPEEMPVATPQDITVQVLNGTRTAGLASKVAVEIETSFGYTTKYANASTKEYKEYIIVDLSGGVLATDVEQLRAKYNITKVLSALPAGEAATDSDIVIIIGQ